MNCEHSSNFQELLQKHNSVTIDQKKYPGISYMIYKVLNNIAPAIVSEHFFFQMLTVF